MIHIALISDIHFGCYSRTQEFSVPGERRRDETSGDAPFKEGIISILRQNNVQYLCAAGDLTSVASPQEFHFCEQTILSIAQQAGIDNENVILGLGNHDINWKISKLADEYKNTENHELILDKYRLIAANAVCSSICHISEPNIKGPAPFSGVVENQDFIMFVLNSGWYCAHDQEFNHGKLSASQLDWFREQIDTYESDARWKIVLIHHHLFNYSYPVPTVDVSMIEESDEFLDIASNLGVNLVLHGHRHHPRAETMMKNTWDDPITFVCAGSLSVDSGYRKNGEIPNTFHILELDEAEKKIILKNYGYNSSTGWSPIDNRLTPLDAEMMLGKIYPASDIDEAIRNLPIGQEIIFDGLNEKLQYIPLEKLNNRIKELFPTPYKVIGRFPEAIYIMN